jgi:predicted TIM-barrel fold metal-dependent hydrolase
MSTLSPDLPITDAHVHFFSPNFIAGYAALGKNRFPPGDYTGGLLRLMGWDMWYTDPVELGRRWVEEMNKHGVARMMMITSWLWDEEATARAAHAFPDRMSGYVMIDPTQPIAEIRARVAVTDLGLKGITLFPAMHNFRASEPKAYTIYRVAAHAGVPVFIHFGLLKIAIREKLGLVSKFDLRLSNPLDLQIPAKDFPETPFIIPHFGGGFFQETLMLASQCPNVHVDTSSSNDWTKLMPYPLTLKDVFARTLDVLGPDRILFGSDSTAFPKGWRKDIFTTQAEIVDQLGCSEEEKRKIFGGNATRIFGL